MTDEAGKVSERLNEGMNEFKIGGYAVPTAGHDAGKCYVIFRMDSEYVYLVDGRIRTLDHPKKKKKMHVNMLASFDQAIADKVNDKSVKNEEIKRAIRLLIARRGNPSESKEELNVKD